MTNNIYLKMNTIGYKNILFCGTYVKHEMNRIQSKDYNIETNRISEVSLSCYDDKQYILKDGYHRLSNFYKSTCLLIIQKKIISNIDNLF